MPKKKDRRYTRTKNAAAQLDTTPVALRARLRRARQEGAAVVELGGGVVGRKLGRTWQVFVPDPTEPEA